MGTVTRCLIVDGYNIINSWPELKKLGQIGLEHSRDKLLELMEDYRAYKGIKVIIVFDAHMVKGSMEKHQKYGGTEVVFTKENETADAYIEKLADEMGKLYEIVVATSDWLIQQVVMGRGAARISSRELYLEVMRTKKGMRDKYQTRKSVEKHTIENRIDAKIYEELDKIRHEH